MFEQNTLTSQAKCTITAQTETAKRHNRCVQGKERKAGKSAQFLNKNVILFYYAYGQRALAGFKRFAVINNFVTTLRIHYECLIVPELISTILWRTLAPPFLCRLFVATAPTANVADDLSLTLALCTFFRREWEGELAHAAGRAKGGARLMMK